MPSHTVVRTLLEKAANDNGFDLGPLSTGEWLAFSSSHVPLRLWLCTSQRGGFFAALSDRSVLRALGDPDGPDGAVPPVLPQGASGVRAVGALPDLHGLLRRAFLLSRTLPDELYRTFIKKTSALPRGTEIERWTVQRVGQDLFRRGLLDYWEGRCAVLGLAVPALLRASHVKPWADCEEDAERLDIFNGLLLAAHLDAAFDAGYITFADDGALQVATALDPGARALLGLAEPRAIQGLTPGHRHYLAWHREHRFKGTEAT